MKKYRKIVMLLAFLVIGIYSSALYANDTTTSSNIKADTIIKNDKTIDVLVSEDDYVRITQPSKINMSTFESKINLMGEIIGGTKKGTEITISIYNKKEGTKTYKDEATYTYTLSKVGSTGTFNQLLELTEGDNKIVLAYVNTQDSKNDKMVFFITRETEESKELIKNYNVFQGVK